MSFRVLITDASSKHSIPLQRHIRMACPDVYLLGHDSHRYPLSLHYGYLHKLIYREPLDTLLTQGDFDMVIPIGGQAVRAVARQAPLKALFPELGALDLAFDKIKTAELADFLKIPRPNFMLFRSIEDVHKCNIPFPWVIKPVDETKAKGVEYATDINDAHVKIRRLLEKWPAPILVQQFVPGTGVGFFGLFKNGKPIRIFMHKRLREYPISGGASCGAMSFWHPQLKEYGLGILKHLNWNGPAMVEFRYDENTDKLTLLEINPKFWGSLELALEAGVNFGADMITLFRGGTLEYSEEYDRKLRFYWPLEGDLLHLAAKRNFSGIGDYFGAQAKTNLGYSVSADILKSMRMFPKLLGKFIRP